MSTNIGLQKFPSNIAFSQSCNPFFLHEKFYREIFMPDSVKETHRIHKSAQLCAIAKTYLRTRNSLTAVSHIYEHHVYETYEKCVNQEHPEKNPSP